MTIAIGDRLPSVDLHEGTPATKVNLQQLFKGKKGILFGVPGAFTPGCSKQHLPSFVKEATALGHKGVEMIVCVAVNDAFVMSGWGDAQGVGGKVRMLADPQGEMAKAMGLVLDNDVVKANLGNARCKRFVCLVEDGIVRHLAISGEAGAKDSDTYAPAVLAKL
uniref:Thioredoxin domain-containing protein n=1 Tax=Oxyrrhis marina TaxID=2969 RepID=A0A7S3UNR0_OXYMA